VPGDAVPCALRAYVAFYVTSERPLRYFPSKTQFELFLLGELFSAGCCTGSYRTAPSSVPQALPGASFGKSVLSAAKIALAFSIACLALASEASATPP